MNTPLNNRIIRNLTTSVLTCCCLLFNGVDGYSNLNRDSLLRVAEKLPLDSSKAIMYARVWREFFYVNQQEALKYAKMSLEIADSINFEEGVKDAHNYIGYSYQGLGNYSQAVKHMVKALEYQENQGDQVGISQSLAGIGTIYYYMNNLEKALEYWLKTMEILTLRKDTIQSAFIAGNIGLVYSDMGKIEEALSFYDQAYKFSKMANDDSSVGSVLLNMGEAHSKLKNYDKAMDYYQQSRAIALKISEEELLSTASMNIGEIYRLRGNYSEALKFTQQAYELALKLNHKENTKSCLLALSECFEAMGDFRNAHSFHKLYSSAKDSLLNKHNLEIITELNTKYETDKKEKENQLLVQENELRELREKEEQERLKAEEEANERRDNIQYTLIFIVILALFGSVTFLGFIQVSNKMAEGLIFFSFLILFEFLLVLLDPFIDNLSAGAPGYKLLFNAALAALIFPAHAFFEGTLKARLVKTKGKTGGSDERN